MACGQILCRCVVREVVHCSWTRSLVGRCTVCSGEPGSGGCTMQAMFKPHEGGTTTCINAGNKIMFTTTYPDGVQMAEEVAGDTGELLGAGVSTAFRCLRCDPLNLLSASPQCASGKAAVDWAALPHGSTKSGNLPQQPTLPLQAAPLAARPRLPRVALPCACPAPTPRWCAVRAGRRTSGACGTCPTPRACTASAWTTTSSKSSCAPPTRSAWTAAMAPGRRPRHAPTPHRRRYYKRISVPGMARSGCALDPAALSFTHANNTLVITLAKPKAVLEADADAADARKAAAAGQGSARCAQQ